MTRRLFTFAALLSLALCLTTAALWVWGGTHARVYFFTRHDQAWQVSLSERAIFLSNAPHRAEEQLAWLAWRRAADAAKEQYQYAQDEDAANVGLALRPNRAVAEAEYRQLLQRGQQLAARLTPPSDYSVPLWCVMLVTATPPLLWVFRGPSRRQRWRARMGQCPSCGYSMTGNTSGVCPECGTSGIAEAKE